MLNEEKDIDGKDASASEKKNDVRKDLTAKNLGRSIKKGIAMPYAKVLLRIALTVLVVSSLALFATGIMRYSELQREKEALEKRVDALSEEIEELKYLVEHPIDKEYIVRMAKEKLGLNLPGEIIFYNDSND
jgi:cell division protein FtsB